MKNGFRKWAINQLAKANLKWGFIREGPKGWETIHQPAELESESRNQQREAKMARNEGKHFAANQYYADAVALRLASQRKRKTTNQK